MIKLIDLLNEQKSFLSPKQMKDLKALKHVNIQTGFNDVVLVSRRDKQATINQSKKGGYDVYLSNEFTGKTLTDKKNQPWTAVVRWLETWFD